MRRTPDLWMGMGATRFVGRDLEMGALLGAFDDAVQGRGQMVLISGEAGIGKSRLVDEFAAEASAGGAPVFRGQTWESGGAPALWPWIQVLRASMQHPSAEAACAAMGPSADVLRELLSDAGGAPTAFASSPESRFLIFDSVATFLQRLSAESPSVLIFEDIHGTDESTLQMLEFVATSSPGARLMLIATFRHIEVQEHPAIDATVARLERLGRHLHLLGLAAEESAELARHIHRDLSDETVEAITEMTAGNPLFVTEVAQLARVEGSVTSEAIAGPAGEGIRRAVRRRLEALPSEVAEVLATASILGRDVDVDLLIDVLGSPAGIVRDAIAGATLEGLMLQGSDGGAARFAHEVIQQALYEDLPDDRRRKIHQRVAELLEERSQRDPDQHSDLIALHYSRSAAEVRGRALPHLRDAGELAMARFAYEGAEERFEAALELVDRTDLGSRCDLMILLGHAQIRAGSGGERETLFEAARLAREAGDGDRAAKALITLGQVKFLMLGVHDDEYIDAVQTVLDTVPPPDEGLRARLLASLAKELTDTADADRRRHILEEAFALARRLGDPETLAEVLVADLTRTIWEQADDTITVCDELISTGGLLRRSASPPLKARGREIVLSGWRRRSAELLEQGDLGGFERDTALILREVKDLAPPRERWARECLHATRAMIAGRFDEVEQRAENVLQVMPNELLSFAAWVVLRGAALLESGRLHEMEDVLDQLVPLVPAMVGMRCYSALAKVQAGRLADARTTMNPVFADLTSVPRNSGWLAGMATVAVVVKEVHDEETAKKLYELLLPHRGKHAVVMMGQPVAYLGPLELHLGMCAAGGGMRDRAVDHLERAIAASEGLGASPWAARARSQLASILHEGAPDERKRADRLAADARATAELLSMHRLKDELESLGCGNRDLRSSAIEVRRQGDIWTIGKGDRLYSVKHSRGFDHLARLLNEPGKEFHSLQLSNEGGALVVTRGTAASEGLRSGGTETAVLDHRAKAEFRARITELKGDIDDADADNDLERAARAREELDFLVTELERATGLGGRARSFSEPAEKARVSVTKAIRRSIDAIRKHDESLADYLERTVSTGLFCYFRPDPTHEAHTDIEVTS